MVVRKGRLLLITQDRVLYDPQHASQVRSLPDPDIFAFDRGLQIVHHYPRNSEQHHKLDQSKHHPVYLLYHEKKVLQLHICWSFCVTNFLCVAEKTCNAKIIRENRMETRLPSISCMRKVVSVAGPATQCVRTAALFSCDILHPAPVRDHPRRREPRSA